MHRRQARGNRRFNRQTNSRLILYIAGEGAARFGKTEDSCGGDRTSAQAILAAHRSFPLLLTKSLSIITKNRNTASQENLRLARGDEECQPAMGVVVRDRLRDTSCR